MLIAVLLKEAHAKKEEISNGEEVSVIAFGGDDIIEFVFTNFIASIVAIFFGAIHCVAWSFEFHSHREQLLWRISSIIVVGIPAIWALLFLSFFLTSYTWFKSKNPASADETWIDRLFTPSIIAIPFYIAARLILLVLALKSLQSLPQAAYQTVTWTTFIPHI